MPVTATQPPQVSVIIPAYNGSRDIQQAIESVFTQTYQNWELIIVDDGSTDNTRQVVQQYGHKLRYFYQENQGVAAARNRGILEAKGELIAFLDQDDWFLPDKLALQVASFPEHPSIGIVHSGWQIVNETGGAISDIALWHILPDLSLADWLLWKPVFLGAMLFRRDWLEFAGGFNCRYHQAPDVDLVLRLAVMGCKAAWVNQKTVCYRQHETNASRNTPLQVRECQTVLERLFARPNLPDEIRQLARQARYNNLVWSAWRLYFTGHRAEMANYLAKSLSYTPFSRTETVLNWIEYFQKYSREYGHEFAADSLSHSQDWQELMAMLF
ncbi:glycosyl transferase [Planktothricoides sp. SR001]|uniref:glycosyltransferase family 2 protein n=1 Tax=Planktothricoides sp. SR001 TaxID=1705388 RepID=UPI0006C1AEF9|nr:glycosyltransferase [Planktothricoides sp. SR001]KOR35686.1 glycosyl transferase [Planktothricoides sp. SR001]